MRAAWLALLVSACSTGAPSSSSLDPPLEAQQLPPPALRRLSVAELSAAATDLMGANIDLTSALPPDARQHDFSRNIEQSVDALTLQQLDAAANGAAEEIALSAPIFPACASLAGPADVRCRDEVVAKLAERGFRRLPSVAELAALSEVFDVGAADATFLAGAKLVARAVLGSPTLLYDAALGAINDAGLLADDELGSQLAWLSSGLPPDDELRRAADAGELRDGSQRRQQALRLAAAPTSRPLYRRFVEEWLGLNRLRSLAKSKDISANFSELREVMRRETQAAVDDAIASSGGSLRQLFAGGYSFVPNELADLYGIERVSSGQRTGLTQLGRSGVLQHASFLSTFAHEAESAPVLRGKAVLERLLCRHLPNPAELGIDLSLPAPDARATTRQRFARHAESQRCASCHAALDGIGFAFENFDAVGRLRDTEAGLPVDTSGHVTLDGLEIPLQNSVDLSFALADSQELAQCAARQVVRFAAAADLPAVEDDFVRATRALPEPERTSILGLLLAYVEGDWFARRSQR